MNKQRQELIKTLYDALKRGEITNGNKLLPERELTEKFNVKRSILREALIALDTLGVIDIRERQGMFVGESGVASLAQGLEFLSDFSPIDIMEQTYEVRLMIETAAAALAAERRSERICALLRSELVFFENFLAGPNNPANAMLAFKHNIILHNLIMEASSNQVLQEIFRGVSALSRNAFVVLGSGSTNFHPYLLWPEELYQEHRAITLAIIEQRSDDAYEAMKIHLRNSILRNRHTLSEISKVLFDDSQMMPQPTPFQWDNDLLKF